MTIEDFMSYGTITGPHRIVETRANPGQELPARFLVEAMDSGNVRIFQESELPQIKGHLSIPFHALEPVMQAVREVEAEATKRAEETGRFHAMMGTYDGQ